ncbi:MAG: exodeoxyribonuclease III, partial [Bdellovibrionota bacterium]
VAIYTRVEPLDVRLQGWGIHEFDREGRILEMDFKELTLINAYFPNSQREHARLPYKLAFCDAMLKRCETLRSQGRHVVVCGDFNIAHRPIDLKNPKANEKNAGYLPEERAWLDRYVAAGYLDTFRVRHPHAADQYTWWSYRPGVREKNIGWRLDYFFVNPEFSDRTTGAGILSEVKGSDHCPVELRLKR